MLAIGESGAIRATVVTLICAISSPSYEARAQSAASELIHLWDSANDRCRGGGGDDPKTNAACDERERYSTRLDELGFCYGHQGDYGSDMYWHHCDARSIRPNRSASSGGPSCVVNDPTPTPLNYRTAPYGRILGNIENGHRVTIIDRAMDGSGKPWAYIADENKQPIGWVFRKYVDCF